MKVFLCYKINGNSKINFMFDASQKANLSCGKELLKNLFINSLQDKLKLKNFSNIALFKYNRNWVIFP